MQTVLLSTK